MERFDISESDRLAEMVSAARAGVEVEIMQDGKVVAHLVAARDKLVTEVEALRASLPAEARAIDWGAAVRHMRGTS